MNLRNALFVIVLFLVWLMGYYYYSPGQSSQSTILQTERPQEIHEYNSEVTKQQEEATYPTMQPDETPIEHLQDSLEQPRPSLSFQEKSIHTLKRDHKKRSKKIKTQQPPQPISSPVIPIPVTQSDATAESPLDGEKTISISSSLVKKDIGYYKMFSWHYPSIFNLTVNGQSIFTKHDKKISENEIRVPINEPFIIRYEYEWHTPWGKRIGAKKVTFKAHADAQHLAVAFKSNWKNEERIAVDGATKISQEVLEEEAAS